MTDNVVHRVSKWCLGLTVVVAVGACLRPGALLALRAESCSSRAEVKALEYWLGHWRVTNPEAPAVSTSTSTVSLTLDTCLIVEDWNDGKGHVGKNLLAYSADDKTWYGMFADNHDRVHVFTDGTVSAGVAEFHGRSRGPDGGTVLHRVKVVRKAPDAVEQTWEQSMDAGTSWKTVFRGEYTRANQ